MAPNSSLHSNPEDIWNQMLCNYRHRLKGKRYADLLKQLEYTSFHSLLEMTSQKNDSERVTRTIRSLTPALVHLDTFSIAISDAVQGCPDPVSFLWGFIRAMLICAHEYGSILETIRDMLRDITLTMTKFNRYIELLPMSPNLHEYLRLLYDDYVCFCIDAIKFLRRKPILSLISTPFSTIKYVFESRKGSIIRHVKEFEDETRITIDEVVVGRLRDIHERLPMQLAKDVEERLYEVPFSRNAFFTGRDSDLENLHFKLSHSQFKGAESLKTCLIHSMGGVGKTQMALEYSYRYRDWYDYIFWLAAENGPQLAQNFANIATLLQEKLLLRIASDSPSPAQGIQAVRRWLERTKKHWLLIYDNVESWTDITPYWPCSTHGAIILTSQHSHLAQVTGGSEISLTPLPANEGAVLLLRHLRRFVSDNASIKDMAEAKGISIILGGLPIAISHMAGYIDMSQLSLPEFSTMYEKREQTQRIWSCNHMNATYQYDKRLETVWDIAMKELSNDALDIIYLLAMLNPDLIQEDLLFDSSEDNSSIKGRYYDIIASLGDRQLVKRASTPSGTFLSIHRALQLNILHKLDQNLETRQIIFERALRLVRRGFPRQSAIQVPSNENWQTNEFYLPHVLSLKLFFERSSPPVKATMVLAELLGDVGNYMWERAFYKQGLETLELAERICENLSSAEDVMEQSMIFTIIGVLSEEVGISGRQKGLNRCTKSLVFRRHHVESNESAGPEERVLLSNAWNDVACGLIEHESYDQAEAYIQRSLAVKNEIPMVEDGVAYFCYAENYKNLSIIRRAQNRLSEAVEISAQAVRLIEDGTGTECASVWALRHHKACAIFQNGDIEGALKLHEQVLKGRMEIFGEHQVHTLNSAYACAVAYQTLGNFIKASSLLLECLAASTEAEWPEECVARAKYRLAQVMRLQYGGSSKIEADELQAQARALREKLDPGNFYYYQNIHSETDLSPKFEMALFDHLVSFEAGRTFVGQIKASAPLSIVEDALPPL
ncbi:MAG: hypothetical protein M1834_001709 [Cirrosporium novae-zelandiae]|nr:MAG: hypothetical protein M1834_001709 [Cirrosporium novae-zelandiae]